MTSSIRPIFIPEQARALITGWAPGPGVLVLFPPVAWSLMWRAMMPSSLHLWFTSWAASMAAYGEDSCRSAFTFIPPVTWQMFPCQRDSDVHKSVVEGCEDVAHTKYIFFFSHLRAEADDLFFLVFFPLARCHFCASSPDSAARKRSRTIYCRKTLTTSFCSSNC